MSASDLHESMTNPAVRGQYLAAIRNRGKDVLINDVSEAMDLLVSMAVKLEAAQKRIAELEANARVSQQARDAGAVYQFQQAYIPGSGNIFRFWVDCSEGFYDEEKACGGTVRILYTPPPTNTTQSQ